METIPKDECQKVGFIRKTHGIHGEMILEFEQEYEYSIEEANRFFVEMEGLLVPFFLKEEGLRFKSVNSAIIGLKWVDTEQKAKRMGGKSVWLFRDEITYDESEGNDNTLENYLLLDEKKGEIGPITRVDDYSGNIVLTVNFRGEEILVPYSEELVVEMDEKLKMIKLNLPEGLLE